MPGGGKISFLSSLYRRKGGECPEGSNVAEASGRHGGGGRGTGGGGGGGKGGRRRRERTPSPVQAEEEEEEEAELEEEEEEEQEQEEQEDEDEEEQEQEHQEEEGGEEEGATGGTRVWLRGPSTLPPRPIPLERRPIIRPAGPR